LWNTSADVSWSLKEFYPAGTFILALVIVELAALLMALRTSVKEFLGKQYLASLPLRALAGGLLGIVSGLLEILAGLGYFYGSSGPFGAGALGVLGVFTFYTGITLAMSGVVILLRKYTLGGAMAIIFGFFPVPYYYAVYSYVATEYDYLLSWIVLAFPITVAVLAFTSRPKTRN
jgi:hypothetical protein